MQCKYCKTKMVEVNIPTTRPEVSAGIMLDREDLDCFLICPNLDCVELGREMEPDFIPF